MKPLTYQKVTAMQSKIGSLLNRNAAMETTEEVKNILEKIVDTLFEAKNSNFFAVQEKRDQKNNISDEEKKVNERVESIWTALFQLIENTYNECLGKPLKEDKLKEIVRNSVHLGLIQTLKKTVYNEQKKEKLEGDAKMLKAKIGAYIECPDVVKSHVSKANVVIADVIFALMWFYALSNVLTSPIKHTGNDDWQEDLIVHGQYHQKATVVAVPTVLILFSIFLYSIFGEKTYSKKYFSELEGNKDQWKLGFFGTEAGSPKTMLLSGEKNTEEDAERTLHRRFNAKHSGENAD